MSLPSPPFLVSVPPCEPVETYSDTMEPGALVLIAQFNQFLHLFLVFLFTTFGDTSWLLVLLVENERDP